MENSFEQLIDVLPSSSSFTVGLREITYILEEGNLHPSPSFITQNYSSLMKLEWWAWRVLARKSQQWTKQSNFLTLFQALSVFNKNLIFHNDQIDDDTKASLLILPTMDLVSDIFLRIESLADDNSLYMVVVNLWFDNLAYFIHECPHYESSTMICHINLYLARDYLMTDQFKFYLSQLQQAQVPQSTFTSKQLFYMKTTTFSLCSYLTAKAQTFSFTAEEMMHHVLEEYIQTIEIQSHIVDLWSEDMLSCITHLTGLISACCWWGGEKFTQLKLFFPTERMIFSYINALIRIISYRPFHEHIKAKWLNDQTILLDLSLFSLKNVVLTQDLIWYFRSKRSLPDTLLSIAEVSVHDKICLRACTVLGETLCDARLKDLKITDNVSLFFFDILQHAWQHQSKKYKQIPIFHLLRGFLTLSKIDAIQQKTADLKKISLLIEMTDEYPVALDILWALSFNIDIQEQLRSNAAFMSKLVQLAKEPDQEQLHKSIHGILWNLEFIHQDRPIMTIDDQSDFDIMISYSHKDQPICKQIYEHLIHIGYRVWIDFDQLHGNVMDAMAQAIERSQMIIICMSEQYRRSNYCRAEAHYAFQRQLKLVPVLLQEHYQPDGWLLFLIGQLLYVDFTKQEFNQAADSLIKELKAENTSEVTITPIRSREETKTDLIITALLPSPPPHLAQPKKMKDWTRSHVQGWLLAHNLVQMSCLLADCDGQALVYLNEFISHSDPSQSLRLLQEDSLRRMNENLSLIELSSLRSLIHQENPSLDMKSGKRSHRRRTNKYLQSCCLLM